MDPRQVQFPKEIIAKTSEHQQNNNCNSASEDMSNPAAPPIEPSTNKLSPTPMAVAEKKPPSPPPQEQPAPLENQVNNNSNKSESGDTKSHPMGEQPPTKIKPSATTTAAVKPPSPPAQEQQPPAAAAATKTEQQEGDDDNSDEIATSVIRAKEHDKLSPTAMQPSPTEPLMALVMQPPSPTPIPLAAPEQQVKNNDSAHDVSHSSKPSEQPSLPKQPSFPMTMAAESHGVLKSSAPVVAVAPTEATEQKKDNVDNSASQKKPPAEPSLTTQATATASVAAAKPKPSSPPIVSVPPTRPYQYSEVEIAIAKAHATVTAENAVAAHSLGGNNVNPPTTSLLKPYDPPKKKKKMKKPQKDEKRIKKYNNFNIFFMLERQLLLQSRGGGIDAIAKKIDTKDHPMVKHKAITLPPLPRRYNHLPLTSNWFLELLSNQGKKRPHRKSHGLIPFKELAQTVAKNYREIDEDTQSFVNEVAERLGWHVQEVEAIEAKEWEDDDDEDDFPKSKKGKKRKKKDGDSGLSSQEAETIQQLMGMKSTSPISSQMSPGRVPIPGKLSDFEAKRLQLELIKATSSRIESERRIQTLHDQMAAHQAATSKRKGAKPSAGGGDGESAPQDSQGLSSELPPISSLSPSLLRSLPPKYLQMLLHGQCSVGDDPSPMNRGFPSAPSQQPGGSSLTGPGSSLVEVEQALLKEAMIRGLINPQPGGGPNPGASCEEPNRKRARNSPEHGAVHGNINMMPFNGEMDKDSPNAKAAMQMKIEAAKARSDMNLQAKLAASTHPRSAAADRPPPDLASLLAKDPALARELGFGLPSSSSSSRGNNPSLSNMELDLARAHQQLGMAQQRRPPASAPPSTDPLLAQLLARDPALAASVLGGRDRAEDPSRNPDNDVALRQVLLEQLSRSRQAQAPTPSYPRPPPPGYHPSGALYPTAPYPGSMGMQHQGQSYDAMLAQLSPRSRARGFPEMSFGDHQGSSQHQLSFNRATAVHQAAMGARDAINNRMMNSWNEKANEAPAVRKANEGSPY